MGERETGFAGTGRASAGAGAAPPSAVESDLESLLARAVQELADAHAFARVAAWSADDRGVPRLVGARLEGSALRHPDPALFEAAAGLEGPVDLGTPSAPAALRPLETVQGFCAAAPVGGGGVPVCAVLLIGDPREPAGRVRPRTLALLGRAAARLAGPAQAAAAARRLARMDAQVRHLDRLASLGGLVAEIVHEIRNPLVSVKTFLQLLPERIDEPEFRESFLEVASDELRRVERLLDVVLEHGRPAKPTRSDARAELAPAFDSVLQLVGFRAADRGVALRAEDPGPVPPARICEDALRQVVLNLVLNAIEATPAGGTVTLSARAAPGGVRIDVDDEGEGVAPALARRLFEPFVSSKGDRPGGLGLAITRRLVEEAGGRIEVRPGAAGGSSFRVTLPAD